MYILNPEKSSGFRTHARKNVINKRGWITLCGSARLISPTAEEETGSRFTTAKNGAEEKLKAAERIAKIPGILLVSGAVHNLEVSNEDSGKGRGILHLCELLGIDPARTMACGDEENDLDMIRRAAFGVAMANALDSVKREADFVTKSNEEDGVADAIEEFRRRMEI